jgi:hypothetical protein
MPASQPSRKSQFADGAPDGQLAENNIFAEFCRDRESIAALKVTEKELQALSRASLLGTLTSKDDITFILSQLRKSWIVGEGVVQPPVSESGSLTETIRLAALAKLNEMDFLHARRSRRISYRMRMVFSRLANPLAARIRNKLWGVRLSASISRTLDGRSREEAES